MARLYWDPKYTEGPVTTQLLADEVEAEGGLWTDRYVDSNRKRCLWGVIEGAIYIDGVVHLTRLLGQESVSLLADHALSVADNDGYNNTPEERRKEMTSRLRDIL
jgi:hypothetical protein